MTTTISVILNLIQNQLDSDFRQDDGYGDDSVRQPCTILVQGQPADKIKK